MKKLCAFLLFVSPLFAQSVYELKCPSGQTSLWNAQTLNPTTGKLRANVCIDNSGNYIINTSSMNLSLSGLTVNNQADADLLVTFQSGTTVNRNIRFLFNDFTGATNWRMSAFPTVFTIQNLLPTNIAYFQANVGGTTYVSSGGVTPVAINGTVGSSVGGLSVFSGGAVPVQNASISGLGAIKGVTVQTAVVAVGSLPTCNAGAEGTHKAVNNALAPVSLATVVTGGAVHVSVYCNGTNWIVQ